MKTKSIYTEIYKTIKNKRNQLGLSQDDMAKKLKMQQAGYSQLENGGRNLTFKRMVDIAAIFEVPVSYLVDKQVQELIDSLIERLEDTNALLNQNSYEVQLPDYKQETIEFYQKKDTENTKLIASLERQANDLRKLSDYQQRELETAKEIIQTIAQSAKAKKTIKPPKLKIEMFLKQIDAKAK